MRGAFEQFYRTWCYAGRSVSGADGWKIRAKSAGLPLPEAEGMADLANYWVPTRVNPQTPPGTRLALFRPSATQALLVHGVLRAGLVGGRAGVSFEHVLARLPPAFSALEAIRSWRSPGWQVDEGDYGPVLSPFAWEEPGFGKQFWPMVAGPSGLGATAPDQLSTSDDAVAGNLIEDYPELPWAHALQACLALFQPAVEKVFIAGQDDAIARLLFVVFYCLPDPFREQLTFSTHENPKGTKGVRIVGVTTFEGEDPDLPRYCYEGQYRAINLFTGARSAELELGAFAALAIDWLRCGQYAYLREVRDRFKDLHPSDLPGSRELDLLSLEQGRGTEVSDQAAAWLELCTSRAIAHARLSRPDELSAMLSCASASEDFETKMANQLSGWLPEDAAASQQFVSALVVLTQGDMGRAAPLEQVQGPGRFARLVAPTLGDRYQERLLQSCQSAPPDPSPPIAVRLHLLESWLALPACSGLQPTQIPPNWLLAGAAELILLLDSGLPFQFKWQALESFLRSAQGCAPQAAEAITGAVCADNRLTRELVLELPRWRKLPGTAAARLPDPEVAKILAAYSQSLTLAGALLDEDARFIEALESWQAEPRAKVPERLQAILALRQYLRRPSATDSLQGEAVTPAFWWSEGGKEEAVNAALDQILAVGTLEDFARALEWFGRGAWARSPVELIILSAHRLAHPGFSGKAADPALREVIELLNRVLREWDQARQVALASIRSAAIKPLMLGASAIASLSRIALRHLPSAGFLKSAGGRELLTLLKKEQHLIDPGQNDRFQKLYGLFEACMAKEPTPDTLLALAQSSLDDSLDADLSKEVSTLFRADVLKAPKLLRPFLRRFFDARPEACARQFLPGFLDYLAERETKLKDSPITEELAHALKDLGNDLAAAEPGIIEHLNQFMGRLPPKSRTRFENSLRQVDPAQANPSGSRSAAARTPSRPFGMPTVLPKSTRSRWRALLSEPALYLYFYTLVLATIVLAIRYRHPIVRLLNQIFNP